MAKIKKLPSEVYEKIKAGEVIEDPASVIRELLDNAIDAKSDEILIEIEEGGISKILVQDNGIGMNREDLLLAYEQHTTSKISHFEDIFKLSTAGFRGEALASITRVSFLKIVSSDQENGVGHSVYLEGGKLIREVPESRSRGTTVDVSHLFFNVPVRQKNLKSPVKELRKIKEEIINRALAYPEISFTLKVNKNISFSFAKKDWEERIKDVFKDYQDKFIPFYKRTPDLAVKGVITQANTTFSSSENLHFFVNHKPVKPRFLFGVINSVFASLIPRGRYPAGVIYIYTDPANIDPNIHPSKKEIKIFIEDQIYRLLSSTLRKLFFAGDDSEPVRGKEENKNQKIEAVLEKRILSNIKKDQNTDVVLDFSFSEENQQNSGQSILKPEYRYIGSCFNTFLICEKEEELFFIDFHAANERKRYEDLKTKAQKVEVTQLLTPRILSFSTVEAARISEHKDELKNTGFLFYLFGEDAVVVNGIPAFFQDKNWEEDFKDLVSMLGQKHISATDLKENLLKSVACKGSYKSGQIMHPKEAQALIDIVFSGEIPLTCPHGRPFIFAIGRKELAAKFLRA